MRENRILKKTEGRKKRALRVRKSLRGTANKPRLCVVKSNKHLQAQLIDDSNRVTLGGISTNSKEFSGTEFAKKSKPAARKIGERIAEMAKAKNVETLVFDRGSSKYHGLLAELASAVREAGIKF